MPVRKIKFYPDTYYHIFNRWFEKQTLFFSYSDYERFYKIILRYLDEFSYIKIHSYCLLPNHFHFILTSKSIDEIYVSNFMRQVQQSYAKYFILRNWSWKWPVFEWRFKAKPIQDDNYLKQCFVYVNFNAIKHKLVDNIEDWEYTSYHMLEKKQKNNYKNISKDVLIMEDLEF